MRTGLDTYQAKRHFGRTAEPRGKVGRAHPAHLSYVIQRHHASRLHFDFRLELDGVLKSWAVPKGPSLAPSEKRLAVEVEDHPLDYGGFEGSIAHGEYGGGYVLVWDQGEWVSEGDPHQGLERGRLSFSLEGSRLHGRFSLVRMRGMPGEKKHNWLLIKGADSEARSGHAAEVTTPASPPALDTFPPQLATLGDTLPMARGYGYEIKLDGYRALTSVSGGRVQIASRHQQDWTARFPAIAKALSGLDLDNAVFDGEVCALDRTGRARFQNLQEALADGKSASLVYFIFDLLFIDGFDVRDRPVSVRKAMLQSILDGVKAPLAYVSHLESASEAQAVLAEACHRGLEGLVAKRLDQPYRAGRTRDWMKVKCQRDDEFVIVGYTKPQGSRTGLGALLLGTHDGSRLRYVCKVGTGFSQSLLRELARRLRGMEIEVPSVEGAPRIRGATWVKPELVCQVTFQERTKEGALRHPSFVGLREDKVAAEAVSPPSRRLTAPKSSDGTRSGGVTISHPDRIIDPSSGATKLDLARYYELIAERMLPFVARRPLAIVRCPDGIGQETFFQKRKSPGMPDSIHAGRAAGNPVLDVDSVEGLISLIQFGAIELHGWGARLPAPEKPDWMVIDLDPDEGLPFARVVEAALEVRQLFTSIGLTSFLKTTGGKGLHLVAPIVPNHGWSDVKAVTQSFAAHLEQRAPTRFTSNMAKAKRTGKIFVDYLRNGEGATAILPYSARQRDGLPVALPIAWPDLKHLDPREFTVGSLAAVLRRRKKDPWADFFDLRQGLPATLRH